MNAEVPTDVSPADQAPRASLDEGKIMTVKRTTRWGGAAFTAAASTLALGSLAAPAVADTPDQVERPDTFTSAFVVDADGEQVVDPDGNTGAGDPEASGAFIFLVNSDEEIICWDITVQGVTPPYESPAKTATHIHQTPAGENGPPRIAFPNPGPEDPDAEVRTSSGCSEGPFTTGLAPDGTDTGEGFTLDQLEEDPAGFSADTHTAAFVPGAVRGQLTFSQELLDEANGVEDSAPPAGDDDEGTDDRQLPTGGVDTGAGGTATSPATGPLTALLVSGLGAAGFLAVRRHQSA